MAARPPKLRSRLMPREVLIPPGNRWRKVRGTPQNERGYFWTPFPYCRGFDRYVPRCMTITRGEDSDPSLVGICRVNSVRTSAGWNHHGPAHGAIGLTVEACARAR